MFKKGGPQNCNELFKNSAVGPEIIGLYSKGEANGQTQDNKRDDPGMNIVVNQDEDTCQDLHRKSINWKPRQNKKSCRYQVSVDFKRKYSRS